MSNYVNSMVLLDDCIWHMNKSIHECLKQGWSEDEMCARLSVLKSLMALYERWERCSNVDGYIE